MEVGSLVETISDFEESRITWGLPYPKKGDILTISSITPHHVSHCRKLGIVLLEFYELPNLIPICDKDINGKVNFIELLPLINIEELIEEQSLTIIN